MGSQWKLGALEQNSTFPAGGICTQNCSAPSDLSDAIWSSVLLVASSVLGHLAVGVCDQGLKQNIEMAHINTKSADARVLLRQLPESISKTIHQTNSPHGTAFQCLMLMAALLMLASQYPKYDFVHFGLSFGEIVLQTTRSLCPVVGILMLIFIPMSHDYILMIERFKEPGYKITKKDKAVIFINKLQEDLHTGAGALAFAVTPVFEGYIVGKGYVEFFNNGIGHEYVRSNVWDTPTQMWFALLLTRTLMLLGTNICLWNMIYEWNVEPTSRCTRNPFYMYNTEKALIRELLNYVLLLGISIWFVNKAHYFIMSGWTHQVIVLLASAAIVITTFYTLGLFWYLFRKDRYLSEKEMQKKVQAIITRTDEKLDKVMPKLQKLHEKWAQAALPWPSRDDDSSDTDDFLCT